MNGILPNKHDSVIFIVPPTTIIQTQKFLYAHKEHAGNHLQQRLFNWLSTRCQKTTFVDNIFDAQATAIPKGSRTAGPASVQPKEVPGMQWGLKKNIFMDRLRTAGKPDQIWMTTLFPFDKNAIKESTEVIEKVFPGVPVHMGGVFASTCDNAQQLKVSSVHRGLVLESESLLSVQNGYTGFIKGARGCKNHCSYCAIHYLENTKPHMSSLSCMLSEIDQMIENGMSLLVYYTPSFLMEKDSRSTERLLDELTERNISLLLLAGLHPSVISPHRAKLLRSAGLIDPVVPLQTLDRTIAKGWGRNEGIETYRRALDTLRDAGFSNEEISSDIIIGHPTQTLEEAIQTACFAWSQGISPLLLPYTIVPRSRDAKQWRAKINTIPAESLHPELWALADPSVPVYHFMQLGTLMRVLPQCIQTALGYLDPDTPVPGLIEKHLNEFGFDIPQWHIGAPLPPAAKGYQRFLSHPWELTLTLLKTGYTKAALPFLNECSAVSVCEPNYFKIPRLFIEAGEANAAISTLKGAINWLPSTTRSDCLHLINRSCGDPNQVFVKIAPHIASALKANAIDCEAAKWQQLLTYLISNSSTPNSQATQMISLDNTTSERQRK